METFYLIVVVFLILLAISDLVVGVSNDAVNFLNSAIGSRAASLKVVLIIAALGVFVGAAFSGGMMEVARKGIFHPGKFYFDEIMIIFLVVMLTDVILLDLFNTFGLPTSTTVSIVFELLGAAVAVSVIKIVENQEGLANLNEYINSDKALAIITGILSSVAIAFICGMIIQFISRLIFSFNFEKPMKYFGGIWGGICVTGITYFLILKGAKGATFMTDAVMDYITGHRNLILWGSFLLWTVVFQALVLAKVNILKIIVLIGTFALAMAFAGNDLVNFIGVPLAGLEAYKSYLAHGLGDPSTYLMTALQAKVKTPVLFLLLAGAVMVLTLYLSKKARSVVKTTLDLSRQDAGYERFESSMLARSLVRTGIQIGKGIDTILPAGVKSFMDNRFNMAFAPKVKGSKEAISFDLVRASVNLLVASILIAIATSYKLPLSTTYVTFMVAMGTSLADRAWNRESAVYRISGVVTVIGGWFFTAISAFTMAFVIANIINFGGITGMVLLLVVAIFLVVRTHAIHTKREEETKKKELELDSQVSVSEFAIAKAGELLGQINTAYALSIEGLVKEKRKRALKALKIADKNKKNLVGLKMSMHKPLSKLDEKYPEQGEYYIAFNDALALLNSSCIRIAEPVYLHVDNNHPSLKKKEAKTLTQLENEVKKYIDLASSILKKEAKPDALERMYKQLSAVIAEEKKSHIVEIKKDGKTKSNYVLYMDILTETDHLLHYTNELIKKHTGLELALQKL